MASYTPERIAYFKDVIFHRRAAGESLKAICADPDWPSRPTLRKWAREDPEFATRIAGGRSVYVTRPGPRFPYKPDVAERFLLRIRLGYPIRDLIREPDMPQERELTAWKQSEPTFAAALAESTAFADANRRRHGGSARGYRRSRMRFDQDVADRLLLAVMRGATLPDLVRRPEFPTRLGLRRWRKAHPEFDTVLRKAAEAGHRARGKARVDLHCSPALTEEIARRIAAGASLHSLSKEADMPGLEALYRWVRDRPDFAAVVADACDFRTALLADRAFELTMADTPAAEREAAAIRKRLGQLNLPPGAKRRKG